MSMPVVKVPQSRHFTCSSLGHFLPIKIGPIVSTVSGILNLCKGHIDDGLQTNICWFGRDCIEECD